MVFHTLIVWLLVAAFPLWVVRWVLYLRLAPRERTMFARLVTNRHESAVMFGLRLFGFLVGLAVAIMALIFTLGYLKDGVLRIGAFRDYIRGHTYSGLEGVDRAIDTFHYNQYLPVALLTTAALLTIAFTLVMAASRDIVLIRRLNGKIRRLTS
ncbi:hypothetical protein FMN50_11800 [Rhodobacterales bacterium]|nr:hypothetical protein FMN50_11800 [Rhodobacterales bacterium]